jgi:hypothetical protein
MSSVYKISVMNSEGKRPHLSHTDTWKDDIKMNSKEMVKVKVKSTLEQTMKAQRGSRGIVLLFT